MILPDGRMIFAVVNFDNDLKAVRFVDKAGRTPIPPHLAGLFSFVQELNNREIPKLKGKIEPVCRMPSQR